MTIKKLRDYLNKNFPDGCLDELNEVLIVDDGMKPKYFLINLVLESKFDKLISNELPIYKQLDILMLVTNLYDEYV